jgi:hypothetical protein
MLTQRLSNFQTALPFGLSISKSTALMNALAEQHNFCVDSMDDALAINPTDHHDLITYPQGYLNPEARGQQSA